MSFPIFHLGFVENGIRNSGVSQLYRVPVIGFLPALEYYVSKSRERFV
jgi:hypothetical protein